MGCRLRDSTPLNDRVHLQRLVSVNPAAWGTCNSIPSDFSPRSLRSMMQDSTQLWASNNGKNIADMKLGGPVGLLPPDALPLYTSVSGQLPLAP